MDRGPAASQLISFHNLLGQLKIVWESFLLEILGHLKKIILNNIGLKTTLILAKFMAKMCKGVTFFDFKKTLKKPEKIQNNFHNQTLQKVK